MKKLITLSLALLFTAGVAFGQSVVDVKQSGRNNTAIAEQHLSDSYQGPLDIFIDQSGRSNYAKSVQATPVGEYISAIKQVGRNNVARQYIDDSETVEISIDQDGRSNFAQQSVDFGLNNESGPGRGTVESEPVHFSIEQDGLNNYALQDIGEEGRLDAVLQGEIDQIGRNNVARQLMSGSNHYFTIYQDGRSNNAKQVVNNGEGYSGSGLGTATIKQWGRNNTAIQLMHDSNSYDVLIDQDGRSNFAKMNIDASTIGVSTEATIEQDGRNNYAKVVVD